MAKKKTDKKELCNNCQKECNDKSNFAIYAKKAYCTHECKVKHYYNGIDPKK